MWVRVSVGVDMGVGVCMYGCGVGMRVGMRAGMCVGVGIGVDVDIDVDVGIIGVLLFVSDDGPLPTVSASVCMKEAVKKSCHQHASQVLSSWFRLLQIPSNAGSLTELTDKWGKCEWIFALHTDRPVTRKCQTCMQPMGQNPSSLCLYARRQKLEIPRFRSGQDLQTGEDRRRVFYQSSVSGFGHHRWRPLPHRPVRPHLPPFPQLRAW